MISLQDILGGIDGECVLGCDRAADDGVSCLAADSRTVSEGDLFVCIRGLNFDGHKAVRDVVFKKAAAIIIEEGSDTGDVKDAIMDAAEDAGIIIPYVYMVKDTRRAYALASCAYFGNPSAKLKTIAVTGTKGKTTTTYMIRSILENVGIKTGLIGTIETIIGDEHIPAKNTTPESYEIQETLAKMADRGLHAVVMEASSQGFKMHRTDGMVFDIGIFTNLEKDHIGAGEHESFEEYIECKSMLFKQCKKAVVNVDDPHWEEVLEGHSCEMVSYGIKGEGIKDEGMKTPDYMAKNIQYFKKEGILGVGYDVEGRMDAHFSVNIPGLFSVYNSLCAAAVCDMMGASPEKTAKALEKAMVKGRGQLVDVSRDFSFMIDYAHNAMSLRSLLSSLRVYEPKRLVVIFGCGGNRSRDRRYEMGEVAGDMADFTIITSDNPRFEEPEDILNDIESTLSKKTDRYVKITDRKEAVRYALENALEGDLIVLAGKGHEDYQEIRGVKHHMDEYEMVNEVKKELGL